MKDISLWTDTAERPEFSSMKESHDFETVVVGAGLTGITTALLLARAGVKVAVIEADTVGSGTSGGTTAKVTVQHGIKLCYLADEKANAYMKANEAGMKRITSFIDELKIDCDFEKTSAYVFARSDPEVEELEKELRAYERLGVPGHMVSETQLPFDIRCALVMEDQAQFHPLKYLYGLTQELTRLGVPVWEKTRALSLERDDSHVTVVTEHGTIRAESAVLATGYPLVEYPGLFFLRLHQSRSYLLAAEADAPDGMYINAGTPVNTLRSCTLGGRRWLLIGGFGHRTAKEDQVDTGLAPSVEFLNSAFPGVNPSYGWSAQDIMTIDNLPYIGSLYKDGPGVYVATGFAKWGMTNSAAASMMITDEMTGSHMIDRGIRQVFSPLRVAPGASAKGLLTQAGEVIREFTAGYIRIPEGSFDELEPDEGAVLRIEGEALAVYKDKDGHTSAFKAHCTHLGCPLEYNEDEKTFDCPCHGSRFSMTGEIVDGPAKKPLERMDEELSE